MILMGSFCCKKLQHPGADSTVRFVDKHPRTCAGIEWIRRAKLSVGNCRISLLLLFATLLLAGCGGESTSNSNESSSDSGRDSSQSNEVVTRDSLGSSNSTDQGSQSAENSSDPQIRSETLFPTENTSAQHAVENDRTLGNLINQDRSLASIAPNPIDDSAALALGIEKIEGQFIDLYTDVRDPVVNEYVEAFDQAVIQWSEYFSLPVPTPDEFHVRGSFMEERSRFARAGLLPDDLPPFPFGFQRDAELWVLRQPGHYYSRHLVLHEGTHAFMRLLVGGCGPPWYMEGMAELLATHTWDGETVTLCQMIQHRDDAPYWGRIKIVRDAYEENRALNLDSIFGYDWHAHLQVEPYGWCWAACAYFDGHPLFRDRFRALAGRVDDRSQTFSEVFVRDLGADWSLAQEGWQLFVAELDYGYDTQRASIRYQPMYLSSDGLASTISAEHGWQSSGITVTQGRTYTLSATGRFQIANDSEPWMCEPNGVTIEYHLGVPLGSLMGAIRSDDDSRSTLTPLVRPFVIGNHLELIAPSTGELFLRVNESSANLSDNAGEITIRLTEH